MNFSKMYVSITPPEWYRNVNFRGAGPWTNCSRCAYNSGDQACLRIFVRSSSICFYIIHFYCIDTSVLLENTPLVKFIPNYIRDSSGLFSISSLVKISMISLISSFSLKLYLNLVLIKTLSGLLRKSATIFGNLRRFSVNVRERLSLLRNNFGKSSQSLESGW